MCGAAVAIEQGRDIPSRGGASMKTSENLARPAWRSVFGVVAALFLAAAGAVEYEFDGRCAMGLASGVETDTDCSITWTADDGRSYCFGSEASRQTFLEHPYMNRIRAGEFASMNEAARVAKNMQYHRSRDVKKFLKAHIDKESEAHGGTFPLYDPLTKKTIQVVFEEIQMMRTLHGYGFFPDAVFHDQADEDKKFWVDFWIRPVGRDALDLFETRIYKGPRRRGGEWQLVTRQPSPWWWIPASEHPGESEHKRGWEIMSAIETHVLEKQMSKGAFSLLDEETGETVQLEYIGIHQPVRKLSDDGRFFACTDFRRVGTENEYYDIDFWLNDVTGTIKVGDVRIHKIPENVDGNWVQVPKYSFEDVEYDVVP